MCEPCLFDEVRCYRLSVDQLTHRRYSGCFNKLSSRPTWLWCAVSPEHKTMFIQQASFFFYSYNGCGFKATQDLSRDS